MNLLERLGRILEMGATSGEENDALTMRTVKGHCKSYKSSSRPSLPYFTTFARYYCDSWGISFDAGFNLAKTRADSLFKEIQVISNDVAGLPEALHPDGREILRKEFEKSAWYDKDASLPLPVHLKANFSHEHKKTVEEAIHSYTVKVPYTVMIPQMRQIPHTTYHQMCTVGGCTSTPLTTYSYENYTVPATRYRDDPRQFNYDRWRHVQALAFHAELLSLIKGVEINASHTQTAKNTDTEHPPSVPDIGLSPDALSLPNPLRWLEIQMDEAAHNWGQALNKAWIAELKKLSATEYLSDTLLRPFHQPWRKLTEACGRSLSWLPILVFRRAPGISGSINGTFQLCVSADKFEFGTRIIVS